MKSRTTFFFGSFALFTLILVAVLALPQTVEQACAEVVKAQTDDDPFGDSGDDDPFSGSDEPAGDLFGDSGDDNPFGGSDEPEGDPFAEAPGQVAKAKPQAVRSTAAPATGAAASIKKELLKKTRIDFDETPLTDAIEMIKEQHGIPVLIDTAALDLAGVSASDETVTLVLDGVSLRSGLRLLLKSLDLTYIVKDEVLLVTTIEEAEQQLITDIYPVVDLVNAKDSESVAKSVAMLKDLLTTTVAPESWDEVGGTGSLSYYQGQLVVAQTSVVHEGVVALLAKLRKSIQEHGGLEIPLPAFHRERGGGGGGGGVF